MTKEELKELKKLVKEAEKIMKKLDNEKEISGAFETLTDEVMQRAQKKPCKISIETDETGGARVKVDGHLISVLIALAGLEKAILKQAQCPEPIWEIIKAKAGIEEA